MFERNEILLPDPFGDAGVLDLGGFEGGELTALDDIPPMETLEADLDAALAEDDGSELERVLADSELSAEEELAFAECEAADVPTLDELMSILQRYPGLRFTISF